MTACAHLKNMFVFLILFSARYIFWGVILAFVSTLCTHPQQWAVREFQMGAVKNTGSFLSSQNKVGG